MDRGTTGTIALILGISFLTSFFCQRLLLAICSRYGLKDYCAKRKLDKEPRPRLGGVGIFLGFFTSVFLIALLSNTLNWLGIQDWRLPAKGMSFDLYTGVLFYVFLIGVLDDFIGLKALPKLAVEFGAAAVFYAIGFQIHVLTIPILSEQLALGGWALPVTMVWIVGIINAINLIDGMDGLAGGVIVLASLSAIVILMIDRHWSILFFVLALQGSVLGFLPFNRFPSRIFMGDGGSLFAGAILATALIRTSQKGALGITIMVPLIILALPVLDTVSAFFRRLLHGQSPFRADSHHIHHRLMQMGFSEEATVNILLIISGICSVLGIVAYFLNAQVRFCVFVALFVGLLGFLKYMNVMYKKNGNLSSFKWMKGVVRSAMNDKLNP